MVKTLPKILICASIVGCVGIVLLVVSYSTDYWVSADLRIKDSGDGKPSTVNHGLFTGSYKRVIFSTSNTYPLTLTCLIGEGVCEWSCLSSSDLRDQEITQLLDGGSWQFECDATASFVRHSNPFVESTGVDSEDFISAGLWIASIFFLSLALLANALAFGFNLYNIFSNPIEVYATILGVYIYYSVAACATLMTLILYGALYASYISNNLGLPDTLLGTMEGFPDLNFSYFILIASLICQLAAIGLLYYRDRLINKVEAAKVIKVDDRTNDASAHMF